MRRAAPLLFLCLWPLPAAAGAISSAYTSFDIKHCKVLDAANPAEEWGGSWLCAGYGGLKVYVAEGDLREMLAYGRNPRKHCAATQSFSAFNSAFPTIEWRLDAGKPFAVIQRFSVSRPDDSDKSETWLAVTRLEDGNSCRAAVIKGSMPKANALARQAADQSRGFDCLRDEARIISPDPGGQAVISGTPCAAE